MTEAQTLFEAGKLGAAIAELARALGDGHDDATARTFLFELLCFAGEWERAEEELDMLGRQSVQAEIGVHAYRNNIQAERRRARVFTEGELPKFLFEPPAYIYQMLEAINRVRVGDVADAKAALAHVEAARVATSGKFNGDAFTDFRDGDDLLAPVLELFVNEDYVWLPFEQIQRIEIAAPKRLRDLLWASGRIEALASVVGEVFLPALYFNSSAHPNEQVRLGRMTDWQSPGEEIYAGAGLKMFFVDGEEQPLFEARQVEFDMVLVDEMSAANN